MPTLPDLPGITWRGATRDDVGGLAAHSLLVHEAERFSSLPGVSFFEWLFEQPGMVLADDYQVAEHEGVIVADTGAWLHSGDKGARCIVWGEASPGFEYLKPHLFTWARQRAYERLGNADPSLPRVIRTPVEDHRTAHIEVIEAAGFSMKRSFAEMARPLAYLPALSPLPNGITVVPWDPDLEESVRVVSNESFADHWGSLPQTAEEFQGFSSGNPTFRPDLTFLALADNEVVSFSICEVDDEDNADRDTDDVYINRVGTRRSHRGLRLASHLIVRSMQAAASAGLDRAALEVDEMSHTNATAVYARLGFETYARSLSFFEELEITRTP